MDCQWHVWVKMSVESCKVTEEAGFVGVPSRILVNGGCPGAKERWDVSVSMFNRRGWRQVGLWSCLVR